MSTSNQRQRKRRQDLRLPDYVAEQEANAMARSFSSRTIDFGKRMNIAYWVDGEKFLTGKKHRANAIGMSYCPKASKVRHKTIGSKHVDLRSFNVHKRIENPALYRTLDIRRVLHLIEYKTGRAKI